MEILERDLARKCYICMHLYYHQSHRGATLFDRESAVLSPVGLEKAAFGQISWNGLYLPHGEAGQRHRKRWMQSRVCAVNSFKKRWRPSRAHLEQFEKEDMDSSNRCSGVLTKFSRGLLESAEALAQQMMAGTPTHDPCRTMLRT